LRTAEEEDVRTESSPGGTVEQEEQSTDSILKNSSGLSKGKLEFETNMHRDEVHFLPLYSRLVVFADNTT
jgi:hypothetical protein